MRSGRLYWRSPKLSLLQLAICGDILGLRVTLLKSPCISSVKSGGICVYVMLGHAACSALLRATEGIRHISSSTHESCVFCTGRGPCCANHVGRAHQSKPEPRRGVWDVQKVRSLLSPINTNLFRVLPTREKGAFFCCSSSNPGKVNGHATTSAKRPSPNLQGDPPK